MNGKSPKVLPLSKDARTIALTRLAVKTFQQLIKQPFTDGNIGFSVKEIECFQAILNEMIDNLAPARIEVDYQVKSDEQ
jgi:hypothetical protein